MSAALFQLGRLVATPGALETMERTRTEPGRMLHRHVTGDWGDVDPGDRGLNEAALADGGRILSVYGTPEDRLWVITEADRSVTTILRPEDY